MNMQGIWHSIHDLRNIEFLLKSLEDTIGSEEMFRLFSEAVIEEATSSNLKKESDIKLIDELVSRGYTVTKI